MAGDVCSARSLGGGGDDRFLCSAPVGSLKPSLDFTEFSLFPLHQRAEQLSNTLKKIAASKTFVNFDLFYVDFDFRESKFCVVSMLTIDKGSSFL